jgi:hypothetical protein
MKKGSLFKVVYQTETILDNWFTIEYKDSEDIKVHFIKNGVWVYQKTMQSEEIYYARDLFNWSISERSDKSTC